MEFVLRQPKMKDLALGNEKFEGWRFACVLYLSRPESSALCEDSFVCCVELPGPPWTVRDVEWTVPAVGHFSVIRSDCTKRGSLRDGLSL